MAATRLPTRPTLHAPPARAAASRPRRAAQTYQHLVYHTIPYPSRPIRWSGQSGRAAVPRKKRLRDTAFFCAAPRALRPRVAAHTRDFQRNVTS